MMLEAGAPVAAKFSLIVPLPMTVGPVYVFAPPSTRVPKLNFVRPPTVDEPLVTTPLKVTRMPVGVLIVAVAVPLESKIEIPRLALMVMLAVGDSVASSRIRSPALKEPGAAPRFRSLEILSAAPLLIVTGPVKVLVAPRVSVPLPDSESPSFVPEIVPASERAPLPVTNTLTVLVSDRFRLMALVND